MTTRTLVWPSHDLTEAGGRDVLHLVGLQALRTSLQVYCDRACFSSSQQDRIPPQLRQLLTAESLDSLAQP